ncbi:MAG: glutamate-1-semialdehyde 2,1-aminomutase [Candidatus Eisenbacteria bacterium]|nr:glutamate-1-semialdehyde 2,1-aminomutase [Candidatus Eisenbacteria bacterium]
MNGTKDGNGIARELSLWQRAQEGIPGGVSSPVRAFKSVGGEPVFISSGKGSRVFDVTGKEYIDYVCSWGPLILGHAHPRVIERARERMEKGSTFGAPTEIEVEMAEAVKDAFPSMERVRFVSSGTEAAMSAVRLARAFTKRTRILKFEGCYHGHADSFLSGSGSGMVSFGIPESPGVPDSFARETVTLPFNDLEKVHDFFEREGSGIAAVIVEPICGNMGCVLPADGFLAGLREISSRYHTLLIFDEVITGFRVAYGGAQELLKMEPDLTLLGKIVGGGFPAAAYGGRKEIMEILAPAGAVYQAGTLSGNPVAMAAGLETIRILKEARSTIYGELDAKGKRMEEGVTSAIRESETAATINRVGSLFTLFFASEPVNDLTLAKKSDTKKFGKFFHFLLDRGVYFPPSQFEAAFISASHSAEDIEETVEAISDGLAALKE